MLISQLVQIFPLIFSLIWSHIQYLSFKAFSYWLKLYMWFFCLYTAWVKAWVWVPWGCQFYQLQFLPKAAKFPGSSWGTNFSPECVTDPWMSQWPAKSITHWKASGREWFWVKQSIIQIHSHYLQYVIWTCRAIKQGDGTMKYHGQGKMVNSVVLMRFMV